MDTSEAANKSRVIAEATDGAVEVNDPAETLFQKSLSDAGAPFERENLAFLGILKARDPAKFERLRGRLSKTGVRVAELDKVIARQGKDSEARPNGSALEFDAIEPWSDPVDGQILFQDLINLFQRYLVLPPHAAVSMALWVIFAHSHDIWQISPRLAFVSPEKRCGKTTALAILQHLVPKPLPASNTTAAAVFRTIELVSPTLLIDEADTFLTASDDLRGILNSGHNKSQAFVNRLAGQDHTPSRFSTWSPVVIAMIGRLPDTLNDRAIVVELKRKLGSVRIDRLRMDRVDHLRTLARKVVRWVADNSEQLSAWDGNPPLD